MSGTPNGMHEVAALIARQPVFDAHMDALQRAVDLDHDLGTRTPGHFDLVRAAEGGLGGVVLVCWVDPAFLPDGARERADRMIDAAHALADRHPERLELISTREDWRAERPPGRVAGLIGIEGGHALEERIEHLEAFAERGLRVLTLVWNNHLSWIRSCQPNAPAGTPAGLSEFGRDVVRRMNALGVAVDLSHAGERAVFDALEVSQVPVIASHSGCRAVHDHPRNLTDAQLRAIGDQGGVVGVVLHPGFLDADAAADERALRKRAAYQALVQSDPTAQHLAQSEWMEREARPLSVERWVDHVQHACELAGPEHVGVGTDFDGIERGLGEVRHAGHYPELARAMLRRGFDAHTVEGVLGRNFARVFDRVLPSSARTEVARSV